MRDTVKAICTKRYDLVLNAIPFGYEIQVFKGGFTVDSVEVADLNMALAIFENKFFNLEYLQ